MRFRVVVDGEAHDVEVERGPRGLTIRVDGAEYRGSARSSRSDIVVRIGRATHRIRFEGRDVLVDGDRHQVLVPVVEEARSARSREDSAHPRVLEIRPPMPGRVVRIDARAGTSVLRGQTLLVLEAMKMQNEIPAPRDGLLREVRVSEGESITVDRVVAVLEVR